MIAMTVISSLSAQTLNFSKIKSFEYQLDDVMEVIDIPELKKKLKEVEKNYGEDPNEINKTRMGIIYHETALNLSFFSKTEYKGYAKKSFDLLSELFYSPSTTKELMPFISSYRASALSLVGAETKKLKLVGESFFLFADAVEKYSNMSYLPEFLRASVAENLPWIFFSKRKFARRDMESIIRKYNENTEFANWKIMSFTYWGWARAHKKKKFRKQAMEYLNEAIKIDPEYKAGRQRAEELIAQYLK